MFKLLPVLLLGAALMPAQRAVLRTVENRVYLPGGIDSNSPAWWSNGQLNILTSAGYPLLSTGVNQFLLRNTRAIDGLRMNHVPFWMEAVWKDPDGVLFGWYHHEPAGLCPGTSLTAPVIGAALSMNNGRSWIDLGIVLAAPPQLACTAQNGFFAGGHGDFSVIADRNGDYLYFFFTNYTGSVNEQGVSIARMHVADRWGPAGAVWKYHNGDFSQPGLGGLVEPVFAARVAWEDAKADSLWGPSIHYNTHLGRYVMLLNRACCDKRWPQEGIYISFSDDISNPASWTPPAMLLDEVGFGPGWYPQVLGLGEGETDSLAGRKARFYVAGISHWEIEFERPPESARPPESNPPPEPQPEPEPEPQPDPEEQPKPPVEPPSDPQMPEEPAPPEEEQPMEEEPPPGEEAPPEEETPPGEEPPGLEA